LQPTGKKQQNLKNKNQKTILAVRRLQVPVLGSLFAPLTWGD
jgi:hypothetical protein